MRLLNLCSGTKSVSEPFEAAGLECIGVVWSHLEAERDVAAATNRMILEELCPVPIIGEVLTDADWIDWTDS